MGNLYTHVIRRSNNRLQILSRLRQIWQSSPLDKQAFAEIRKLQQQLRSKKKIQVKKKYSEFGVFQKYHEQQVGKFKSEA